jgi:hypothetical protein
VSSPAWPHSTFDSFGSQTLAGKTAQFLPHFCLMKRVENQNWSKTGPVQGGGTEGLKMRFSSMWTGLYRGSEGWFPTVQNGTAFPGSAVALPHLRTERRCPHRQGHSMSTFRGSRPSTLNSQPSTNQTPLVIRRAPSWTAVASPARHRFHTPQVPMCAVADPHRLLALDSRLSTFDFWALASFASFASFERLVTPGDPRRARRGTGDKR